MGASTKRPFVFSPSLFRERIPLSPHTPFPYVLPDLGYIPDTSIREDATAYPRMILLVSEKIQKTFFANPLHEWINRTC
jgi:hypothetical protein